MATCVLKYFISNNSLSEESYALKQKIIILFRGGEFDQRVQFLTLPDWLEHLGTINQTIIHISIVDT